MKCPLASHTVRIKKFCKEWDTIKGNSLEEEEGACPFSLIRSILRALAFNHIPCHLSSSEHQRVHFDTLQLSSPKNKKQNQNKLISFLVEQPLSIHVSQESWQSRFPGKGALSGNVSSTGGDFPGRLCSLQPWRAPGPAQTMPWGTWAGLGGKKKEKNLD